MVEAADESERAHTEALGGPIGVEELHEIAEESSRAERRAADAERELMEGKKVKFMQDRVGEDFDGLITSVTKFGFFVELTDLFVEGLVPLNTLTDDRYTYHENTREIIGQRSRKIYSLGQKIRVLVDRIDPVEKKIQFAVLEEEPVRSKGKRKKQISSSHRLPSFARRTTEAALAEGDGCPHMNLCARLTLLGLFEFRRRWRR